MLRLQNTVALKVWFHKAQRHLRLQKRWDRACLWLVRTRPCHVISCLFLLLSPVSMHTFKSKFEKMRDQMTVANQVLRLHRLYHISDLYSDPSKPLHLFPSYRQLGGCQHLWRYFKICCCPSCTLPCSTYPGHTPHFGYMTLLGLIADLSYLYGTFFCAVKIIILIHEQP